MFTYFTLSSSSHRLTALSICIDFRIQILRMRLGAEKDISSTPVLDEQAVYEAVIHTAPISKYKGGRSIPMETAPSRSKLPMPSTRTLKQRSADEDNVGSGGEGVDCTSLVAVRRAPPAPPVFDPSQPLQSKPGSVPIPTISIQKKNKYHNVYDNVVINNEHCSCRR